MNGQISWIYHMCECSLNIGRLLSVLFKPKVFSQMATGIASVVAVLTLSSSQANPVFPFLTNKVVISIGYIFATWTLASAFSNYKEMYKRSIVKDKLGELYLKGKTLIADTSQPVTEDLNNQAKVWINAVQQCFRKYLDNSWAVRFDIPYRGRPDATLFEWGEIQLRVYKLEELIRDIQLIG